MRGVARNEDPAIHHPLGIEKVLLPAAHIFHLVVDRHANDALEDAGHLRIFARDRVQGEMFRVVLHDEEGRALVDKMIVPTASDGDPLEEIGRVKEPLAQFQQIGLAFKTNAKGLADQARPAIAAHHEMGAKAFRRPIASLRLHGHSVCVLSEPDQFMAEAHVNERMAIRMGLQKRFERILGNELVGFSRQCAIIARGDLRLKLRHRRIGQTKQGGLRQREDQEDVHGDICRKSSLADLLAQSHPPVDFHGAGVAPLHLGQAGWSGVAIHEQAGDAAPSQIKGEREPSGASPDDDHIPRLIHMLVLCCWGRVERR